MRRSTEMGGAESRRIGRLKVGDRRRRVRGMAVAVSLVLAVEAAAQAVVKEITRPEDLFEIPTLNRMVWVSAPRTRRPPVLDGTLKLEEGEWADAPAVYGMLDSRPPYLMPLDALVFLTWDEENLYLGVRTEVKPGYVLRRRGRTHDSEVNRDDVVEIFFNPLGRDQPEPAIFQIMYNALGYRWDCMQTVGVRAMFWDADTWEFASDYKPGMPRWDMEVKIPVRSLRMKRPNRPGDAWLTLITRDWKWLMTPEGQEIWNIYSSLTGHGHFISQENQFPLVLEEEGPVVQLLDLKELCEGRVGWKARFTNPSQRPQSLTALVTVHFGERTPREDWTLQPDPLISERKEFKLPPGASEDWSVSGLALPEKEPGVYGFAFKVIRPDRKVPVFARQCSFRKTAGYGAKVAEPGYPMRISYNPVRHKLWAQCDLLDHPRAADIQELRVELFGAGETPAGDPIGKAAVTAVRNRVLGDVIPVPALNPGKYPVRLTLVERSGASVQSKDFRIEKVDEAATFPWWGTRAGVSDKPMPPYESLRYEGRTVRTTTGRVVLDGSGMPEQIHVMGEDLLAAPVRLTAAVQGRPIVFARSGEPVFERRTEVDADVTGELRSEALGVRVRSHIEYDGAQWITLDIEPRQGTLAVDYLRLEIPFHPARAGWLFSMTLSGQMSWMAKDLSRGDGVIWDSRNYRGLGMTIGTFVPQYLVSDSLRGLCWYANSDRGWVPTDDVPATEVVRAAGETVLRFNLIGKPFTLRGARRIQFGLLGMPPKPLQPGARIVLRAASHFGNYLGDKVMNYSSPLPRDFAKAKDYLEKGTVYDPKTFEPIGQKAHKEWNKEFAPWHDSHTPWKTPDLDPRTYEYFAAEFGDYGFVPRLVELRAWQWDRYLKAAPVSGIYYDTASGMGFSRSIENDVAYVIPEDQPGAGQIQGGYTLTGFREQIKRIYTVFHQNGVDHPWVEMTATHGFAVPASGFLTMILEGEDYRRPSFRHFMYAWPVHHLRAIDSPHVYGLTVRWLGGYPWDNSVRDADPLRCQIAALIVHDIWTPGFGAWHATGISGKGVLLNQCDRPPPYGFRIPGMGEKLVTLGMNLAETRFLPYWDQAGVLSLTSLEPGKLGEVRASGWWIPSQNRLVIAVGNWNEEAVACTLKVNLAVLKPAKSDELIATDLETDEVLARGRTVEAIACPLRPLDFRLFMVAAVEQGGPAVARSAEGALSLQHADVGGNGPVVPAGALEAKLLGLGLGGAGVKPLPASDRRVMLLRSDGQLEDRGVVAAWHIPSQRRLVVAVGEREGKQLEGKLKFDLGGLGLMPRNNGECIIISDIETDKVLLKTTGMNWKGQLLGLWQGLRDAEGRRMNSPHDEVRISVPQRKWLFLGVATQ